MGVSSGRWRADIEGDLVVFVIGTRVNKPWLPHRWLPVLLAMPPMVREAKSVGLLGAHWGWMYGQFTLIQFWRSYEELEAYARAADARHLPAWKRYNQRWRGNDATGVFHETYKVRAGEYEAIYVDEPRCGLAAVAGHARVGSDTETSAQRIGARAADTPPVSAG